MQMLSVLTPLDPTSAHAMQDLREMEKNAKVD